MGVLIRGGGDRSRRQHRREMGSKEVRGCDHRERGGGDREVEEEMERGEVRGCEHKERGGG